MQLPISQNQLSPDRKCRTSAVRLRNFQELTFLDCIKECTLQILHISLYLIVYPFLLKTIIHQQTSILVLKSTQNFHHLWKYMQQNVSISTSYKYLRALAQHEYDLQYHNA